MASQPTFAPPEVPHIAATASLSEPDPVRPKPGGSIFRGDVVEDLDLPPALCISEDTSLARAIERASICLKPFPLSQAHQVGSAVFGAIA